LRKVQVRLNDCRWVVKEAMLLARPRWRLDVALLLAGLATLPSCGGHGEDLPEPPPRMDATATPADAGAEGEPEASAPSPDDAGSDGCACRDATTADVVDAPLALDGSEAEATAPLNDMCHAVWPQPAHLVVDESQIAVDPQGNAYLAITYHGDSYLGPAPTIDFGAADAGAYPVGVAIAKVDPACHLLWVREIGDAVISSVENHQIAVDAQSNVTIMGVFEGSVDFGGTTLSSPDAGGAPSGTFPYLVRFDASGNVLYIKVFGPTGSDQEVSAWVVRMADDATSTVVVAYWNLAAVYGDASGPAVEESFLQLDPTGAVVSQTSLPTTGPWFAGLVADPDGGLWGLQGTGNGLYAANAPVILAHLSGQGAVDWTQWIDGAAPNPFLAVASGNALLLGASGSIETFSSYARTGALSWTQTTQVAYSGASFAYRLLVDPNGAPIVAGEFFGTTVTSVDGSTFTDPTPSGMGFQEFDSTGHFRSVKTWNGAPADISGFGDVAVDSQGHVLLLGSTGSGQERSGIFFAKLAE
jgi:hypothetical protein